MRRKSGHRLRRHLAVALATLAAVATTGRTARSAAGDLVVYASDATTYGQWTKVADSLAAGGEYLSTPDLGSATLDSPLGSPASFFEATVTADAGVPFRVWLRMRATANSKWNDSVWVQFSDAINASGASLYRIGTSSGLLVNLEACKDCGMAKWGWQGGAYWLAQTATIRFASNGAHTIRVQTREDGVRVDQIVLSPSTFLNAAPGPNSDDTTIVPKVAGGSMPYGGSPAAVPGTIQAEDFDNGGEGVAYHDTGSGNAGGAYRQTGVDLEGSSEGGYDVGWIAPSEWLKYTVNVAAAGTYTATFRVASMGQGGTFHLEMNGSDVTGGLSIPNTGGWQSWTTLTKPVTLAAGQQQARLVFDAAGSSGAVGNLNWFKLEAAAPSGGSGGGGASTPFNGSPANIPGAIEAEYFDDGGEGVAYHDTGSGNAGGAFRQTGVDLEASSEGGYNVGWTSSGEWLNYTVNVASSGSYTVKLRVASTQGATLHVGFNGSSPVWQSVSIPNTGGWQQWTTVSFAATLGAGRQLMTVTFDTGGVNLNRVDVASGTAPPPPPPPPPPPTGTDVPVVQWNIQVNDSSAAHARAAIAAITAMNPQPRIVVLTEARSTMYSTYISELQARTGLTWSGVFKTHCPPGKWNGSSCTGTEDEGVGVFTSYPLQSSSSLYFPYSDSWHSARAAVRAAITVNGGTVQVFGLHLIPNDVTARYNSMTMLKNWASSYSKPQLVGGDFNADPDQVNSSQGMGGAFVDATVAVGSGGTLTALLPSLTMRLDYLLSDVGGKAQPQWAVVVGTGSVSDHLPVLASYRITP